MSEMKTKRFSRQTIPVLNNAAFRMRLLRPALLVAMLCLGHGRLDAQTPIEEEDFENVKGQLVDWSATWQPPGEQAVYRPAAKWDSPFVIVAESAAAHSGSQALKWEFSAEIQGRISLNFPPLQVNDTELELRFFVKTQGIDKVGSLAVDEADATGKRLKNNWAAVKIPPSDTWTEIVWRGKVGGDVARLRVFLSYENLPAGATVWIDDITIKAAGGN
jgi:hypothetical protein